MSKNIASWNNLALRFDAKVAEKFLNGTYLLSTSYIIHMFLSTLSVMMPTVNEVLYDYNPYFHASKFCIGCTANIMKRGFGVVQWVPTIFDRCPYTLKSLIEEQIFF